MLQGEVRQVLIEFTNTGTVPLTNLKVASTDPNFFTFGGSQKSPLSSSGDLETSDSLSVYSTLSSDRDSQEFIVEQSDLKFIEEIPLGKCNKDTGCKVLAAGQTVTVPLWIYGPCGSKDSVMGNGVVGLSRDYDMQMTFMYQAVNEDNVQQKMK